MEIINNTEMIADISTGKGETNDNVNSEYVLINSYPWTKLEVVEFPMQTIDEIKPNQITKLIKSTIITGNCNIKETSTHLTQVKFVTEKTEKRYIYSHYLIDPNQHIFKTVMRIITVIKRLIKKFKYKVNLQKETPNKESICHKSSARTGLQLSTHDTNKKYSILLSDKEIKEIHNYSFKKPIAEIEKIKRNTA